MQAKLAELFAAYQDPDGLFNMVYPRAWKVERASAWNKDRTVYTQSTIFAPEDVHQANVNGYLSEGIRVMIELPKKGRAFTKDTGKEYGEYFVKELLRSNPGFALTAASAVDFNGQQAKMYSLVGQGQGMPEPEKTVFVVLANEKYRVIIELVSPASKLQAYEAVYMALMETFELGQ